MFIEDQSPGERSPGSQALYECLFSLFRENKVEIASAITRVYPFLMSIRDRGFISEQKFEEFIGACENLVPVERVMYDVLCEMENNFDEKVIDLLFSKFILKNYPDLLEIFSNFQNALRDIFYFQDLDEDQKWEPHDLQLDYAQGDTVPASPEHLSDEQKGSTRDLSYHVPDTTRTQETASECVQESEQAEESTSDGKEPREAAGSPQKCQPESSSPVLGSVHCSSSEPWDPEAPQMTHEDDPGEGPSQRACDREEDSDTSLEMSAEESPQQALSSPARSEPAEDSDTDLETYDEEQLQQALNSPTESGSELPALEKETCPCVMCSPKCVPASWKAGPEHSHACDMMGTVGLGTNSTLARVKRKRKKKKGHSWTRIKRIRRNTQNAKRTKRNRSRNHRHENVDFHSEILPVTCGEVTGMLHKRKLQRGTSVRCIQCEDGNWLTPRAFEVKGGLERSKNWKKSLRCGGIPLQMLIEDGFLDKPPRNYNRRRKGKTQNSFGYPSVDPYPENSNTCEVCGARGLLLCCDTCPRSFHKDCHIPLEDTERDPWSCTFCEVNESSGSQPRRGEAEVLARPMQPEEQLKCALLLMKVYGHSESSFFKRIPHYYYIKEVSQKLKEPMWLDKIKKKLNKQGYSRVQEFVRDMRLIFQNHKVSYKSVNFGLRGLKLEAEFEKNFKEVFAIQETTEDSPPGE
ncbi:nuclear body protein SP140-like protein isoform X3 [Talpa occidentalis]|uniref:nuclear body protein SP140-like protein isoform X3 n=1 Tax=Talpa occidentalis TaxID=50954 RepID=UPI00188F1753|nr:nuclear body protein SP140-like protein isoform X3 [Talpa occidentalis]